MRAETLKRKILSNPFVDKVRVEMSFDEEAYCRLRADLEALAFELRGSRTLDRELALALYSIPSMIRNAFLSFAGHPAALAPVVSHLEDAWMELDSLVTECLAD